MQKVKVAVNGYGTIGMRVADAVAKQDDLELVGITKFTPKQGGAFEYDSGIHPYSLYVHDVKTFQRYGYPVAGSLMELLSKADVVVDCSDKKGKENKKLYADFPDLKQVFQGGEKEKIAEVSFVAQCNYQAASGKKSVRVVSCNTTGASRALNAFRDLGIIEAKVDMVRRTVDPRDGNEGMVNALEVEMYSHHADDIWTIFPGLAVSTNAVIAPVTQMHMHLLTIDLGNEKELTLDFILQRLGIEPRILLVHSDAYPSTSQVRDLGEKWGRGRAGDIYENVVWKDKVRLTKESRKEEPFYRVRLAQAIHQEADVVPETIDAIRAMFQLADKDESIWKTNQSLGISNKKREEDLLSRL